MGEVHYSVAPEIFGQFPGYIRGVLVFDQLRNSVGDTHIEALLRQAEHRARDGLPVNVADMPRIAAWRAAYRQFGAKPSEHRSSIEALLRRVGKPDSLPSINALVDIGNIVSLRHALPAGVHPLAQGEVTLQLRIARPGDRFRPADEETVEAVPPGEVVLAVDSEVLTRRWTWRQSVITRTLPETTRVFFNIDGLPPTSLAEVRAAMDEATDLVRQFCGGTLVAAGILQAHQPTLCSPA